MIDQRFTFFLFYNYIECKKYNKDNFSFGEIIEDGYLHESELLIEYQKANNKGIFQAFYDNKDIPLTSIIDIWSLNCRIDFDCFDHYFNIYFKNLKEDLLIDAGEHNFISGYYHQEKSIQDCQKLENNYGFSYQLNEIAKIIYSEKEKVSNGRLMFNVQDVRFNRMHIIDMIFYLYFHSYVDIVNIKFTQTISIELRTTVKFDEYVNSLTLQDDVNIDLIRIGEEIFYDTKKSILYKNDRAFPLKNTKSHIFLKILLGNLNKLSTYDYIYNSANKNYNLIIGTDLSNVSDICGDHYTNLGKNNNLGFIKNVITQVKGEGYQINTYR